MNALPLISLKTVAVCSGQHLYLNRTKFRIGYLPLSLLAVLVLCRPMSLAQ